MTHEEKTVFWSVHVDKAPDGQTIYDNIPVQHKELAKVMVKAFKAAGYSCYALRCEETSSKLFKDESF